MLPYALDILSKDDRIEMLVLTNTIPLTPEKSNPKITVLSIAPLLADIIYRIHEGLSISEKLILS
jgi:ribose-phosphate pyrophosphokinase